MAYDFASTVPPGEKEKVYSITELTRLIKDLLEGSFPSIWVEGEVGKATYHTSGHLYLTLKEEKDVLDVTMWRTSLARVQFRVEPGMKVIVRGRMSNYGPYGKYNMVADRVEPAGLGALQIKFEQLKKKLAAKGYFDEERKRPLPPYPKTIGIVTSAVGAAFKDIARIIRRRNPAVKMILAPVLVEGEQAKFQVAQAIDDFNAYGNVDLLIVGRGGGSPESLWTFNEEIVADAIYRSRIPVISAVGHEIDFTIADFTADLRASTPSAAAEMAVPNATDLRYTVEQLQRKMHGDMVALVREQKRRVADLIRRPVFTDPSRAFEPNRRRVDECLLRIANAANRRRLEKTQRLAALMKHLRLLRPSEQIRRKLEHVAHLEEKMARTFQAHLGQMKQKFTAAGGKLDMLSPMKVLDRGYAIARLPDGTVIKDAALVSPGDPLEILLHKGRIDARVEKAGS